jgi:hypothetical protein
MLQAPAANPNRLSGFPLLDFNAKASSDYGATCGVETQHWAGVASALCA